jgi:cell division protein FtsI (penicillin-binding protein 3)
LAPQHQLLAQSKVKEKDLDDDTPDHPGEPLETAEVNSDATESAKPASAPRLQNTTPTTPAAAVVPASIRERISSVPPSATIQPAPAVSEPDAARAPIRGTVVLDVEQGGIEVPSFVGKTVRGALEVAQDSGLQLEPVGSGVARQQTPAAGTHVQAGARVTVQFGR